MSKNEILEKYFLKEIETENNEVDLVGYWIVGKVESADQSRQMKILKVFETDSEAWLENFKFMLLENGYVLSNRDCSAYLDDIMEAMSNLFSEYSLGYDISERVNQYLKDPNNWKVNIGDINPEVGRLIAPQLYWWQQNQVTCTSDDYILNSVTPVSASNTASYTCSSSDATASAISNYMSSTCSVSC